LSYLDHVVDKQHSDGHLRSVGPPPGYCEAPVVSTARGRLMTKVPAGSCADGGS
jgi:hypothetical protein